MQYAHCQRYDSACVVWWSGLVCFKRTPCFIIVTIDYVTGIGNTLRIRGRLILILQLHCRCVSITTQAITG